MDPEVDLLHDLPQGGRISDLSQDSKPHFEPVALSHEFSPYPPAQTIYPAESAQANPWMEDLDALSFKKDPFPHSPSSTQREKQAETAASKEVITFEEVPPVYTSSHSSGSQGKRQAAVPLPPPEPEERSFEVITYESPVEGKGKEVQIELGDMKIEGVEGGNRANKEREEPLWPEITIQMPPAAPEPSKSAKSPNRPLQFTSLPEISSNQAFFGRKTSKKAFQSDTFQDFEEDALGEAREWQVYSANPERKEDQNRDREDEFSFNLRAEVAIKLGGERQYTSEDHIFPEVSQEEGKSVGNKGKRVSLAARKRLAEGKQADSPALPQYSDPVQSPEYPVHTPLKVSKSPSVIFAEFEDPSQRKRSEDWSSNAILIETDAVQDQQYPGHTPVVTYTEVWPQFEQIEVPEFAEKEVLFRPQRISWLKRCFGAGPEDIEISELREKCGRVVGLTQVEFSSESALHRQVLLSVWKLLTGRKEDCPRTGLHWGEIGFQGTDPATDLRGMGVFGLLQLLYFSSVFNEEAKMVLARAQQQGNSFPFAAQSLTISKMVIDTLRGQSLNPFINKWRNVFDSVSAR